MRKFIAALAVAFALPALAVENLPTQAVEKIRFATLPMSSLGQVVYYQADTVNPWLPAYSPPTVNNSVKETQGTTSPVTRTVPTIALVGRSAGLNLSNPQLPANQTGVAGVAVTICAPSGNTLAGAGTVEFYVFDSALPEWSLWSDGSKAVTATGVRCQTFDGIWIPVARGRVFAQAKGVTFTGGGSTGVTLFMIVR